MRNFELRAKLLVVVFLAPMLAYGAEASLQFKQLAGPPAEMRAMAPADPVLATNHSKSALLTLELQPAPNGRWTWSGEIPVERDQLRLAVVSPSVATAKSWTVLLRDPVTNRRQSPEDLGAQRRREDVGISGAALPADVYEFARLGRGRREISIESDQPGRAALVIEGAGPARLASYQAAFNGRVGQHIALIAYLYDDESHGKGRDAGSVTDASLRVTAPGRSVITSAMFDDGLHEDGQPNDGVYGGEFVADRAGNFNVQIVVNGRDHAGSEFVRTAQHVIPVVDDVLNLPDQVAGSSFASANRLEIAITASSPRAADHYRVYAEVWGLRSGASVPVAWIGGMTTLRNGTLKLGLDTRWITLAAAEGPFELRNIRVEEPDHFITIASSARMLLLTPDLRGLNGRSTTIVIDEEMRMGPRPPATIRQTNRLQPIAEGYDIGFGHKLLLVHGYCSGDVWGPVAYQFSNAALFLDLHQNRSIDSFAQQIVITSLSWNSYAIVAHSQGGMAAVHVFTYYWSGLDNAGPGRLIQSVGTPYQGTALAGDLAILGSIFGVGCGANADMTYSGAQAWLAGIPSTARAKVNYYTTSFADGPFYDYCNLITDLLLTDPDDGVVERAKGQLPGAVNQGHTQGWCHTSGMRDPAQTTDSSRNSIMSASAAVGPPAVITAPASAVGQTSATLNGSVNASGAPTATWFEYGTTTAYGNTVAAQNVAGFTAQGISAMVSLNCGTVYHARAVATNAAGTRYGADQTFTTLTCPCSSFSIAPGSANPLAASGSQNVTITGTPAGCAGGNWTAAGNGSWLTVAPASGSGPGSVTVAWQQNTSGTTRSGSALIAGNTFAVTQSAVPSVTPRADFDGDGRSDVILQNATLPAVAEWRLDASGTSVSSVALISYLPNASWRAVASGDFNGDGKADLVLQNSATGDVAVWQMNGMTVTAYAVIGSPGAASSVIATGDFNGDGKSDIVLQSSDNVVRVWQMNGMSVVADGAVSSAPASSRVVVCGDFDGNGKSEIVLQSAATGEVTLWRLNAAGTALDSSNTLIAGNVWKVVTTGDFNGDGRAEIAIQNPSSGDVGIWRLDATGTSISALFTLGSAGAVWKLVGAGDFNGDSRSDVLLQNSGTGDAGLWQLDSTGTAIAIVAGIGGAGVDWVAMMN